MSQEEKIAEAMLKKMQFTGHPVGSFPPGLQPGGSFQPQLNQQPAWGQNVQQLAGHLATVQPMNSIRQQQTAYVQPQQPASGQEERMAGMLEKMQEIIKMQQFTNQPAGSNGPDSQPSSQQQMLQQPVLRQKVQQPTVHASQPQQPLGGQQVYQQHPANGQNGIQEQPHIGLQVLQQQPANGQHMFQQQPANGQPRLETVGFGGQQPLYDYSQQGWAGQLDYIYPPELRKSPEKKKKIW